MGQPLDIIVVDDSALNREAVSALLRCDGHAIREVSCAEEALEIAKISPPDLFLIDVRMPGMGGLGLLERLASIGGDAVSIVMTAQQTILDAKNAMELGALSYIGKPILREELKKQIDRAAKIIAERKERTQREWAAVADAFEMKRAAEKTLHIAEFNSQRLDLVLSSMQEGLLAIDLDQRVMLGNAAANPILNVGFESAIGLHIGDVLIDRQLKSLIDVTIAFPKHEYAPIRIDANGIIHWFVVSGTPIKGVDQSSVGYLFIFTDKTEQVKAQELRSGFLNLVAHEFRTPINVLLNCSSLIDLQKSVPEEVTSINNMIREAGRTLTRLVDIVIRISALSKSNVAISSTDIDVTILVQALIDKLKYVANEKSIRISTLFKLDSMIVYTDVSLLSDALQAILENAVQHCPRGATVTLVAGITHKGESSTLTIAVSDTGTGISQEKLESIFDWFEQCENPYTRYSKGLGLGLPLAKRAVALLGGDIKVVSKVNVGSTFTIVIPFSYKSNTP